MEGRPSPRLRRIQKEYVDMMDDPPPDCSVSLINDSLTDWLGTIQGPAGTVYEGGVFRMKLTFPKDYPFAPPKVVFQTRVYHCNINSKGEICLDILKERWTAAMTVSKVLLSITSLLNDCNPKDPLVPEIARQFVQNRTEHDRHARQWTQQHAQRR